MKETAKDLANAILENVGGLDNIKKLSKCSTSIRIQLKNEEALETEKLKENPDIITVTHDHEWIQIVLGKEVDSVFEILDKDFVEEEEKKEPAIIRLLSGIFAPILMILSAAGLIKGLLALCVFLNLITEDSGTYTILYTIADGFFYYMPIFLGYTSAKQFGCNSFLGMAIGAALCYPTIVGLSDSGIIMTLFEGTIFESGVYTTFFDLPVILPDGGYTSTVLPVILAVAVAAPLSRFWDKVIPDVVKAFLSPVLTLLITVPLTFLVVGPFAALLSGLIGSLAGWLYNLSPFLEGAFVGGFWQVLVILGLHWALVPIMILNLSQLGYDAFLQPFLVASFGQTFVVLAIYLRTKNKDLKEVCIPAIISGFFGVTEPALYGVTLPRIKYFIIGCVASAIGGAFVGFMNVKTYIFGGMGILSLPGYISPDGDITSAIWAFVSMVITSVIAFVVTFVLYKDNRAENNLEFKKLE